MSHVGIFAHPPPPPPPAWFSMLRFSMLREFEELAGISGMHLSTQRWSEILPGLASLPLRSLSIARCGLM